MGLQFPAQRAFKVEEGAGSGRARPKEAQGQPSQGKGWGSWPYLGHVGKLAPWPQFPVAP